MDVWLAQNPSCPFCKQAVEPPSDEAKRSGSGGGGGLLGSSAASVRNFRRWLRNHDRGSGAAVAGAGANPATPDRGAEGASTGGMGGGGGGGTIGGTGESGAESGGSGGAAAAGVVVSPAGGGLGGAGDADFSAAASALAATAISSALTATDTLGGSAAGRVDDAESIPGRPAAPDGARDAAAVVVEEDGEEEDPDGARDAVLVVGDEEEGQGQAEAPATEPTVPLSGAQHPAESAVDGADAEPLLSPRNAVVEAGAQGVAGPDPDSPARLGAQ